MPTAIFSDLQLTSVLSLFLSLLDAIADDVGVARIVHGTF